MQDRQPTNNLPVALTRFIGRAHDISEVKTWLSRHRLVTLTGPGGCCKTRLANQVASELVRTYAAGVWLVEFAPISDRAFITQVAAAVVGVRGYRGATPLRH